MPAPRLHFVRHGQVLNPEGLLYGRIPGFGLSELGHRMAEAAALKLKEQGITPSKLVVSPLQRTQESAIPWQQAFGLEPVLEDRIIEPWNKFEGYPLGARALLAKPALAIHLYNPAKPSWGEPFQEVVERMQKAALEHGKNAESDVVFVSHQLPIELLYRSSMGMRLPHNPRSRRTSLSSVTSFEIQDGKLAPVSFLEPGVEVQRGQA